MKRITAERYARAFAAVQAYLIATEGLAVRQFRARRALNRQAPEPTKQDRRRIAPQLYRQHGAP